MEISERPQSELSSDINIITAEINAYQRVAGEAIFEIGRRLKHVKENDLAHGEWERWLREEVRMSPSQGRMFIKVVEEFGENRCTFNELGLRALYEIATLPPDQREQPHTIPSTGETKTVDEMTVRELREVKKALKEAKQRAKEAEEQAEKLRLYEDKFGSLDHYTETFAKVTNSDDLAYLSYSVSDDIREFMKKYAFIQNFETELSQMNSEAKDLYMESFLALRKFVSAVMRGLTLKEAEIIDI